MVDRLAVAEQLRVALSGVRAFPVEISRSQREVERRLTQNGRHAVISTVQKLPAPGAVSGQGVLVVLYDIRDGARAKMADSFPEATLIAFSTSPGSSRFPEDLIFDYSLKRAIDEKVVLPVRFELRTSGAIDSWASDILCHFERRLGQVSGKGLVSVADSETALRLHQAMVKLSPPHIEVGLLTSMAASADLGDILTCFRDPSSSLRLAVTVDFGLTGFDVPSLHTIYIGRKLNDFLLLQCIARVNRLSAGKLNGLLVDYTGEVAAQMTQWNLGQ